MILKSEHHHPISTSTAPDKSDLVFDYEDSVWIRMHVIRRTMVLLPHTHHSSDVLCMHRY